MIASISLTNDCNSNSLGINQHGTFRAHSSHSIPNEAFNSLSSMGIRSSKPTMALMRIAAKKPIKIFPIVVVNIPDSRTHEPRPPNQQHKPIKPNNEPVYAGCRTKPYGPAVTSLWFSRTPTSNVKRFFRARKHQSRNNDPEVIKNIPTMDTGVRRRSSTVPFIMNILSMRYADVDVADRCAAKIAAISTAAATQKTVLMYPIPLNIIGSVIRINVVARVFTRRSLADSEELGIVKEAVTARVVTRMNGILASGDMGGNAESTLEVVTPVPL